MGAILAEQLEGLKLQEFELQLCTAHCGDCLSSTQLQNVIQTGQSGGKNPGVQAAVTSLCAFFGYRSCNISDTPT